MNAKIRDIAENKSGSLVIGTSPFRSAGMMPEIAKRFRGLYPGMHLVIEERETGALIEGTEHGEFDFCLSLLPVDEHIFAWEKVMEEEIVLAVPSSFAPLPSVKAGNRKYDAVDAKMLNGLSLVMISETQVMQRALDNLCRDLDIRVGKAAVVKSLSAQVAMVRAGVGAALVPTGIERFCAEGEVRFYSFIQELPRREVAAIWRKDRYLSEAAQALIEGIKKINW